MSITVFEDHMTAEAIRHLAVERDGQVTLDLTAGQSAWNPASTKHELWGPATVRYTFHRDGGVDAEVLA